MDLGFYTQAYRLKQLPADSISSIVGRVAFPVLSMLQHDGEVFKKGLKKALTVLVMVNFPLMIGIAVCSQPIIIVLFTEKWAPAIPYLQLLCISGLLYPLQTLNLNVLKAKGRSELFFRLEIIKRVLVIISLALTYRWGVLSIIYGQVVLSVIAYFLNSYYTGILTGYSSKDQVKDFMPYLLSAGLMGGSIYSLALLPFPGYISLLLAQITFGIIIYIVLCRLFKLVAFIETWETIKTMGTGLKRRE